MIETLIAIVSTLLMVIFAPMLARRLGALELLALPLVYFISRFFLTTFFWTTDEKP